MAETYQYLCTEVLNTCNVDLVQKTAADKRYPEKSGRNLLVEILGDFCHGRVKKGGYYGGIMFLVNFYAYWCKFATICCEIRLQQKIEFVLQLNCYRFPSGITVTKILKNQFPVTVSCN